MHPFGSSSVLEKIDLTEKDPALIIEANLPYFSYIRENANNE